MDNGGLIQIFYQEHFEQLCQLYENDLSESEHYCMSMVHDGIADIDFRTDAGIPSRRRIFELKTVDDLHALLTGFFDAEDPTYTADDLEIILHGDDMSLASFNTNPGEEEDDIEEDDGEEDSGAAPAMTPIPHA